MATSYGLTRHHRSSAVHGRAAHGGLHHHSTHHSVTHRASVHHGVNGVPHKTIKHTVHRSVAHHHSRRGHSVVRTLSHHGVHKTYGHRAVSSARRRSTFAMPALPAGF